MWLPLRQFDGQTFNGAGVFQHRKQTIERIQATKMGPSMGPVSFNTGNRLVRKQHEVYSRAFNGAGVFQHRKLHMQFARHMVSESPSMGPVSFNTGNVVRITMHKRWLIAFNGAGVFQHRKPECSRIVKVYRAGLQWGRCLSTPETANQRAEAIATCGPSMGPVSFNTGNAMNDGLKADVSIPSMGPVSFNTGNKL